MDEVQGYTNSQTWEAWKDTFQVLWENTEIVFLLSVSVSLAAVVYTWLYFPKANVTDLDFRERRLNHEGLGSSDLDAANYLEEEWSGNNTSSAPYEETEFQSHPNSKKLTQDIEEIMSEDEKEKELQARNEQLEAIFNLMQKQKEKFGETSMDDIKEQMKFYC